MCINCMQMRRRYVRPRLYYDYESHSLNAAMDIELLEWLPLSFRVVHMLVDH